MDKDEMNNMATRFYDSMKNSNMIDEHKRYSVGSNDTFEDGFEKRDILFETDSFKDAIEQYDYYKSRTFQMDDLKINIVDHKEKKLYQDGLWYEINYKK